MAWDWDRERKAAKNLNIAGCVFSIIFLVVWLAIAPSFMKLFGFVGLAIMIYRLYLCFQLSTEEKNSRQREANFYNRSAIGQPPRKQTDGSPSCPYCGQNVEEAFVFCPMCGRRLP